MSAPRAGGIGAALAHPGFRWLWMASLALNLTIWMQSVAAAWLMVSLTTSPLMVALIQSASALPSFLFALPSGVAADLVERRRYLLWVIGFLTCTAALLCMLARIGGLGPWLLLGLTFCIGIGFALQGPSWYMAQTESVPVALLASAMALSSLSYSCARALGPALAGVIVSWRGVVAVFASCALLMALAFLVLLRWKNTQRPSALPPESLLSGMRSVLRYVPRSDVIRQQVLRTVSFVGVASAVWALLPLIAGARLQSGAGGYGLLLASMGAGSVAGAFLQPKLLARYEINRVMGVAALLYAGGTLVAALVPNLAVVCGALFFSGTAWLLVGNTNMMALQTAVPLWIRARSLSVFMLAFQGAMALGSALWGLLAGVLGLVPTLVCSALLMLGVCALMRRVPARMGQAAESSAAPEALYPHAVETQVPPATAVAVQITYQVGAELREAFLRQVHAIGRTRRRDGASSWQLYRDLAQPDCYVERFSVESWDQYLRQRSRATLVDVEAERQLRALHSAAGAPRLSHFVAERCP